MKRLIPSALAGMLFGLGLVPAGQAMEILRWERLPLAVPLVVGQERVVFIDRNVRIGVPDSVGTDINRLPIVAVSVDSVSCSNTRSLRLIRDSATRMKSGILAVRSPRCR